ncbi:MAG: DDE-type integrase/transposase/recombinase [Oxalobacteraceae bacterium]|nr:DDE-type integrase/transposase/recombinase [Oxalobacteraceae bacterium]
MSQSLYFNAQELASHRLLGMPGTRPGMEKLAKRENWPNRPRSGKGGGVEYPITCLPAEAQTALLAVMLANTTPVQNSVQTNVQCAPKVSDCAVKKSPVTKAGVVVSAAAVTTAAITVSVKLSTAVTISAAPTAAAYATDKQRIVADARMQIIKSIQTMQVALGASKGIDAFVAQAKNGLLPAHLQLAMALGNDKNGFQFEVEIKGGLRSAVPVAGQNMQHYSMLFSRPTAYRLMKLAAQGWDALLPGRRQADMRVPAWAGAFLTLMQRPQKPSLSESFRVMDATLRSQGWSEAALPSEHQVRRWYDKYSNLDKQRGRNQGSALNPYKFAHKRTAAGMLPMQEVHSDGWGTKFTAPHPVSGKYVKLEVWHARDVATRYVFKPSVGLSESMLVIMGSLYNAIEFGGPMAVWQTDNTGSVKNDKVEFDPITSIAARAGISIVHNIPGNSQANGISENFNQYLDSRAKELTTYMGKTMDSLAQKRVLKITQKLTKTGNAFDRAILKRDAEKAGSGYLLESFAQATDWIEQRVAEYNHRPHRALPKVECPETGKKRHQTPAEAWALAVQTGWQPAPLENDDLIDLFRPHERVTVRRGNVSLFGQQYHHQQLEHFNNEIVMAAYDLNDGERVWVKTMSGQLICEAPFYAERGYRAESFYELAMQKRSDAQVKRLVNKIDAIDAQRSSLVLENRPTEYLDVGAMDDIGVVAAVLDEGYLDMALPEQSPALPESPASRPLFDTEPERYRWLKQNTAAWRWDDAIFLRAYIDSPDGYHTLAERFDYQGLAWDVADEAMLNGFFNGGVQAG